MGEAAFAKYNNFKISWPTRNYKAKPEKIVPAQEAYSKRSNTIQIKEDNEKEKVTKLWQGKYVSVRDYEVQAAIKKVD